MHAVKYMKRAYLSAIGDLKRGGEDPIMGSVRQRG